MSISDPSCVSTDGAYAHGQTLFHNVKSTPTKFIGELVSPRERGANPPNQFPRIGGARRDRTDDLMLAKHALSQLSYGPFRPQTAVALISECAGRRAGKRSVMRWRWLARTDLNCRPHAYPARALTS